MLLATILQFDTVINPARLWDMFRKHLCDDLKRRSQREGILEHPTQDDVYDFGLYLLGNVLKDNDSQDYPNTPVTEMPRRHRDWDCLLQHPILQARRREL
jgi:hypothetical protein